MHKKNQRDRYCSGIKSGWKGRCKDRYRYRIFRSYADKLCQARIFDLNLTVKGDLYVDCHHTIEDTGIVLGKAIKGALGDKKSIKRFGNFFLPMDETLVMCAIDLSGRPYLVYDLNLITERVGYFDTQMVKEFFYAVSYGAEMNLNLKQFSGSNDHHIIEAAFKAFAKALDEATSIDDRLNGKVLSTKGSL